MGLKITLHPHPCTCTQEFGEIIHGDCNDFEAVPGHGLKCTISGLEKYSREECHDSNMIIRHAYVTTETSLVAENMEGASPTKKYQVRIRLIDSSHVSNCLKAVLCITMIRVSED